MATATVRRKQVRDETFKLFTQEGLDGWKVRFNPRLSRTLGRCIPSQKTIEYQPRYMQQNDWAQVVGTIQHEVAHAVAGYGHGHDAYWASIAKRLGIENPSAVNHTATIISKFKGTCPNCSREIQKDRRSRQACGKCCNELNNRMFTSKYLFVWTRNA